jgi:hypothetical protein
MSEPSLGQAKVQETREYPVAKELGMIGGKFRPAKADR